MIINDDIINWCKRYKGPPFMAMLCDPPYELEFMGRRWDNTGISFRPETWDALKEHLYPGAWCMAFASTRGWHRMAVAIEDAGFVIQPTIGNLIIPMLLGYAFGSGFPKATRVDVQIDRAAGAERPIVGKKKHQPKFAAKDFNYRQKDNGFNSRDRETFDLTAPATELAAAWEGHRYGGQTMKPAFEPVIVFQKPYEADRPVEDMMATGAGALWIDGARIVMRPGDQKGEFGPHKPEHLGNETTKGVYGSAFRRADADNSIGRWPANLILTHTPDCGERCIEDCPVQHFGEQSGYSQSKRSQRGTVEIFDELYKRGRIWHGESTERGHNDEGTAARFFYQADWSYEIAERLACVDPVFYCAKAASAERDAGLDAFPPVVIDDGREKSIDNAYQRGETTRRNPHPTLKAIRLTQHLATLLLPPVLYAPRRILIPFAGVGSEYIGAMKAGWEEIIGVELTAEYTPYAEARIAYWRGHDTPPSVSERQKVTETTDAGPEQLDLFGEAA